MDLDAEPAEPELLRFAPGTVVWISSVLVAGSVLQLASCRVCVWPLFSACEFKWLWKMRNL